MIYRLFCFLICLLNIGLLADKKAVITGVGSCTIDILAQVDDAFFEKHLPKGKDSDCYYSPEKIEAILADIQTPPRVVPGGSSANTIRALSQLGESCAFIGDIGEDNEGVVFTNNLINLNIQPHLKKTAFTPRVLCLISSDGERTFLGSSLRAKPSSPSIQDLQGSKWVHLEARKLLDPGYLETFLKITTELGIKVSIDLSSPEIAEKYRNTLIQMISDHVEIVFANQRTMAALTQLSPEEGCMKLQQTCPLVVVTLGSDGCMIGSDNSLFKVDPFLANAIDTTGAGDYFAAGFLFGYLHEMPIQRCGQIGNLLGSAITEVIGTELPQEKWDGLRKMAEDLLN